MKVASVSPYQLADVVWFVLSLHSFFLLAKQGPCSCKVQDPLRCHLVFLFLMCVAAFSGLVVQCCSLNLSSWLLDTALP